jgi:hypothetical protein
MGPREALAQITAIINQAKSTHDIEEIQRLLAQMEDVAHASVSKGTLRQARLLQLRHRQ